MKLSWSSDSSSAMEFVTWIMGPLAEREHRQVEYRDRIPMQAYPVLVDGSDPP
jgi:hypothetical protein